MSAGGSDELKRAYLKVRQRIKSHSEPAGVADGNVEIPVARELLIQIAAAADVEGEDDASVMQLLDTAQVAAVGIVEQLEVSEDGTDVKVPKRVLMPVMKFIAARIAATQVPKPMGRSAGGTNGSGAVAAVFGAQASACPAPLITKDFVAHATPVVPVTPAPQATPAAQLDEQPVLPVIRRLRVCLLGGEGLPSGVGKTDVAAALMRGLTCDWPSMLDPIYEFAYDCGVFEKAWSELLADPPEDQPIGDRWGIGPLGAWSIQGHIIFSPKGSGRATPPYELEGLEECAALCPGHPEKLGLGQSRAAGTSRTFRDLFTAAGIDGACLEEMHKELYSAAEAKPLSLVCKDRPAQGFSASFARFSPEVGDFAGCGTVFLDVFEPTNRPHGREHNVAMLYTAAPSSRFHSGVNAGSYLRALQFIACNMARLLRVYNGDASGDPPGEREKAEWHKNDLRQQVEYYLSDRNLKADAGLRHIANDSGSWLEMEQLADGVATQQELLEALSSSKTVATKVDIGGKGFLRPAPSRVLPAPNEGPPSGVAKRKLDALSLLSSGAQAKRAAGPPRMMMTASGQLVPKGGGKGGKDDDKMCWDWARGNCNKGATCKWIHMTLPSGLPASQASDAPLGVPAAGPCGSFAAGGMPFSQPMSGGMSAPSSRPPIDPALLVPGSWVQIQGLASKTEFNGRIGVMGGFDEETARWEVQLADGLTLKVKEENILVSPSNGGPDGNTDSGQAARKAASQFRVGARVRIQGLQGDTSYNGSVGVCNLFDEGSGRWDVQLDDGGSLRVKEANLYRCFS
mmetsp:Transcript_53005/g.124190  ORF Transcript_53005/g.124190 Transcript_53005/m.124190 type:complete len:797 (+) Transcript_53005:90-2480(+)